jgi:starch synthase (maltosyl-transferring)
MRGGPEARSNPRSELQAARALPRERVLIERVTPQLDGGRFAVKRVVGDTLVVGADVIKDGHDQLAARVSYRVPDGEAWQHAPMAYDFDSDRWSGEVVLGRLGRWTFTVEAWADPFATWCVDLEKRLAAGTDVAPELLEGVRLIEQAMRRARSGERPVLTRALALLRDADVAPEERARGALAPALAATMAELVEHQHDVRAEPELAVVVDPPDARFAAWYEMFPRSQAAVAGRHGTFADAERSLARIAALGFDTVYLPPIHPIGSTHRKGRDNSLTAGPDDPGSPWAIGGEAGGHTAVDPRLGTLADFERFVTSARALGIEVALDYALQCSPDHPWTREHPDWFFARPDGTIRYAENPPKKYQDIYPLDFWCTDREALWRACLEIVRFWMARGVRVFRVDNPHTKPLAFWEWLIAEIKAERPDAIFLAEAFTRPKRMQALAKLGFTQSYTYFTWRNTGHELTEYLTELTGTEIAEYFRGNLFTNTPDILHEYLQAGGRPAFRVRLVLAATLSPLYGIYSGFELCENVAVRAGSEEYLHSEKYEIRMRDWQAPGNINADVETLNRIRRANPALQQHTNLSFHISENERILFYRRGLADGTNDLLIAVNLDPQHAQETMVHVPLEDLGIAPDAAFVVQDLLTDERYTWRGVRNYVRLDPAAHVAHVLRVERA